MAIRRLGFTETYAQEGADAETGAYVAPGTVYGPPSPDPKAPGAVVERRTATGEVYYTQNPGRGAAGANWIPGVSNTVVVASGAALLLLAAITARRR